MDKRNSIGRIEGISEQQPEHLLERHLLVTLRGALGDLAAQAHELGDDASMQRAVTRVKEVRSLREALHELAERRTAKVDTATYLVSTSFLVAAHRVLTRTRNEHLVYATGPEDGECLFALTRLVCFKLAGHSIAHASPEPSSQTAALVELDQRGERLLATLHSHPGRGINATVPSSVDLATQDRLERAGYPAIGVVFSRDGCVRFFSVNRRFRVEVSGTGNNRIGDRLFQLTDLSARPWFRRGGRDDSVKRLVPRS